MPRARTADRVGGARGSGAAPAGWRGAAHVAPLARSAACVTTARQPVRATRAGRGRPRTGSTRASRSSTTAAPASARAAAARTTEARSTSSGPCVGRWACGAGTAAGVARAGTGLATRTPDLIRRAAASAPTAASPSAPSAAHCPGGSARARSTAAVLAGLGRGATRSNCEQQEKSRGLSHDPADRDSIMRATRAAEAIFQE